MHKKTIVITGSTRGIGYGLALEFLKKGQQVVINGRNEKALNKCVGELKNQGYEVSGVAGNITDEKILQALLENGKTTFGKIDIWINNAGIPQPQKYFIEIDSNTIKNLINTNITALMLGSHAVLNFFKLQGFGKLFNMEGFGSDGRMMDKLTLYGTSKRAVHYFTKSLSKEVKEKEIQVGILSPGMVRTDFLNEAAHSGNEKEQKHMQKVFDILAEDVETVTPFLADKILASTKKYDRIEFLTFRRLFPKLLKLTFVK